MQKSLNQYQSIIFLYSQDPKACIWVTELFALFMLSLYTIIHKHDFICRCCVDNTYSRWIAQQSQIPYLNKAKECKEDIWHGMLSNFRLLNSDNKLECPPGPQAARCKLFYVVISLWLCWPFMCVTHSSEGS